MTILTLEKEEAMNNTKSPKQILNDVKTELKSYWSSKNDEELMGTDFKVDDRLHSRNVLGAHVASAARYVVHTVGQKLNLPNDNYHKVMEKISDAIIQALEEEVAK